MIKSAKQALALAKGKARIPDFAGNLQGAPQTEAAVERIIRGVTEGELVDPSVTPEGYLMLPRCVDRKTIAKAIRADREGPRDVTQLLEDRIASAKAGAVIFADLDPRACPRDLARLVTRKRKRRGWTQEHLARKARLSTRTVYLVENNLESTISLAGALRLAELLGLQFRVYADRKISMV